MVPLGIEAEERDAESILAACRTVAAPRIAAGPHEDGHHVEPEAERRLHRRLRDLHRERDRLAGEGDRQGRGSVGGGVEDRPYASD